MLTISPSCQYLIWPLGCTNSRWRVSRFMVATFDKGFRDGKDCQPESVRISVSPSKHPRNRLILTNNRSPSRALRYSCSLVILSNSLLCDIVCPYYMYMCIL